MTIRRLAVSVAGLGVLSVGAAFLILYVRSSSRGSVLHAAVLRGDIETVRERIAQGADVNAYDSHRRTTAIGVAASCGRVEIMKLLLNHGADVNRGAALYYASRGGQVEAARMLLSYGADPNMYYVGRVPSPVLAAVEEGNAALLDLLIAQGARVPDVSTDENLVRAAAVRGHAGIVELLVRRGHNCDSKDSDGCTPLWLAAREGFQDVVALLAEKGADINVRAKTGKDALTVAVEGGHMEVVDLLRRLAQSGGR